MLEPATREELQSAVRDHQRVLAVGGGTKTRLAAVGDDCQRISTRRLCGITEYEPSEYTFTALAGTTVAEVHEKVGAKGQFLPCSALLRKAGATLGGAIASGASGPGRFRFGGLRDFLLGIEFVSGDGGLVRAGGKVVKNAAGFDLPKFMVGSLGRFGVLTEVTFKVFPMPSATISIFVHCDSHQQAVARMIRAAASRWELYALDYDPSAAAICLRLGGPAEAIVELAGEIGREWPNQTEQLSGEQADAYWQRVRELEWAPAGSCIAKIPLTPKRIPGLQREIETVGELRAHYSVGGNVAFIAAPDAGAMEVVSRVLEGRNLSGLTLVGESACPLWIGDSSSGQIGTAVKSALDPLGRYPSIND